MANANTLSAQLTTISYNLSKQSIKYSIAFNKTSQDDSFESICFFFLSSLFIMINFRSIISVNKC